MSFHYCERALEMKRRGLIDRALQYIILSNRRARWFQRMGQVRWSSRWMRGAAEHSGEESETEVRQNPPFFSLYSATSWLGWSGWRIGLFIPCCLSPVRVMKMKRRIIHSDIPTPDHSFLSMRSQFEESEKKKNQLSLAFTFTSNCRYHVFGHIHQKHGVTTNGVTTFINAALTDHKVRYSFHSWYR